MTTEQKIPIDEIIHCLIAAVLTLKVMEIADKMAGDVPIYQTFRPMLISSLLYASYKSVRVSTEPVV